MKLEVLGSLKIPISTEEVVSRLKVTRSVGILLGLLGRVSALLCLGGSSLSLSTAVEPPLPPRVCACACACMCLCVCACVRVYTCVRAALMRRRAAGDSSSLSAFTVAGRT